MARNKIGDLLEIKTSKGISYALYTHQHKKYGFLIRLFRNVYTEPLVTFESVLVNDVQCSFFFPLNIAVRKNIVKVVSNLEIPSELSDFPIFRTGFVNPDLGKVETWWLWDGINEERIGKLSKEQKSLPIRGIWNDTILIERIESGWTPSTDKTT